MDTKKYKIILVDGVAFKLPTNEQIKVTAPGNDTFIVPIKSPTKTNYQESSLLQNFTIPLSQYSEPKSTQ